MEQMKYDVFISYSRKDYVDENGNVIPGNEVSKIKESLTTSEITFWMDEKGIVPGEDYAEKILKHIKVCKIFVFISSVAANQSEWTRKEIACAWTYKKKVIPLLLDDSPFHDAVMMRIVDLDRINYYINPEKGMEKLITSIKRHLNEFAEEERRKKEEEERQKEIERKKIEAEKQKKEQEKKNHIEAQKRIITEIRVKCRKLNNEETKLEADRSTLLASTEMITDEKKQEEVKEHIISSSPFRKRVEEEKRILQKDIDKLQSKVETLTQEKTEIRKQLEATKNGYSLELEEKEKRIIELEKEKRPAYNWYKEYKEKEEEAQKYESVFWILCGVLFLLIGFGVFFWWHGNLKFFFPREKVVVSEVVEIEMDSCFVGKSGKELFDESWDYLEGRNGKKQDTVMAFMFMKASAELGYVGGKSNLGWMFRDGLGVEQNYQEAVRWFREAAEMGNSYAQFCLGRMYDSGMGVKKNNEEAVKWYRKSAEQGYQWGQYYVGLKYQYGQGVEKDSIEAIKWYKKAALQGHYESKNKLEELFVSIE